MNSGSAQFVTLSPKCCFLAPVSFRSLPRYLFFVPWMYMALERRRVPTARVALLARQEETKLIEVLEQADTGTPIGHRAGERLKPLPSNIYWQGLGHWGIRHFPGSQDAYHRSFDSFHTSCDLHHARQRERDDEPDDAPPHNWHTGLPEPPPDFPAKANFRLRLVEADYLRERILTTSRGTLLAFLVDHGRDAIPQTSRGRPTSGRVSRPNRREASPRPAFLGNRQWRVPFYNLLLAEKAENHELCEDYRTRLREWATGLRDRSEYLASWDRTEFWRIVAVGNTRVPVPTQHFINEWLDLALFRSAMALADLPQARRLIEVRERQLKKGLARLVNQRALELWNGDAGTARLDYRWPTAQTIIGDILEGLNEEVADVEPRDRRLLLESLRPPNGYTLDHALGTTFSLDLLALLTAPLAFTLFDADAALTPADGDGPPADPLALLLALRRQAGRISLFCQAGRIVVPARHQLLFGYLESSVFEATAPDPAYAFHPKLWLLRFDSA